MINRTIAITQQLKEFKDAVNDAINTSVFSKHDGVQLIIAAIKARGVPNLTSTELNQYQNPGEVADFLSSLGPDLNDSRPSGDPKKVVITKLAALPQCAICGGLPTHSVAYRDPDNPGKIETTKTGREYSAPTHFEYSCDNCLIDAVKLTLTKVKLGVE